MYYKLITMDTLYVHLLKYPSHVNLTDKQARLSKTREDNEHQLQARVGGHLFIGTPVNWMSPTPGVGQARSSRALADGEGGREKKDHLEGKRFI